MRRLAALLVGALFVFANAHAFTFRALTNFDGSWDWINKRGEKAQGGGNTCVSGFTCASRGGATCQFENLGSGRQRIIGSGAGACTYTKAHAGQTRHLALRIESVDWNTQNFAVVGIIFDGGTVWTGTPSYRTFVQMPQAGTARFRVDDSGTPEGQSGIPGTTVDADSSYDVGFEYNGTTFAQTGWEGSSITSEAFQIGTAKNDGAITSGNYGAMVIPVDTGTVTAVVRVLQDTTSLSFVDATVDPNEPPANTITNRPGGPPWPSGNGSVYSPHLQVYDDWITYPQDLGTMWFATNCMNTWARLARGASSDLCNGVYLTDLMAHLPVTAPIVISQPMLPADASPAGSPDTEPNSGNYRCTNPGAWDDLAAIGTALGLGPRDQYWTTWATNLRNKAIANNRDPANHIIRLGWEMNGEWYPWSICNNVTEFKASWVRIVSLMRQVIPGLKFDFSPAGPYVNYVNGSTTPGTFSRNYGGAYPAVPGCNLECFLPDDDYFDYLSHSVHDNGPIITNEATWNEHVNRPAASRLVGLSEVLAAAIAHNKLFALSEWGVNYEDCDNSHVPSAQPAYMLEQVYAYLQMVRGLNRLGFETYFGPSCGNPAWPLSRQSGPGPVRHKQLWDQ